MTQRRSDDGNGVLRGSPPRRVREDLPVPKSVRARGTALERVLQSLLRQGFVEDVPVGLADESWRSGDDGRFGLRIMGAGLRAIGVLR